MNSDYTNLSPMELARLFTAKRRAEINIAPYEPEDPANRIKFSSRIISLDNGRLILQLSPAGPDSSNLPAISGQIISLHTGHDVHSNYRFTDRIIHFHADSQNPTLNPPNTTSQKQRESTRFPLHLAVTYQVVGFHQRRSEHLAQKIGLGVSHDLSETGINLVTNLLLPVGLKVKIEITVANKPLSLGGSVQWTELAHPLRHTYAAGIRLTDRHLDLQNLIAQKAPHSRFYGGRIG